MNHLAVLGGTPVCYSPVSFNWLPKDYTPGNLVKQYLDNGMPLSIPGRSGIIASCEDELKKVFNRKNALLCSSGTMALYSAYFAAGIKPGDKVICTNITYQATSSPALHLGAKIILCDVEEDTGNLDPDQLIKAITPDTRCLATNAMWGHALEQEKIRNICDKHNILWIEDVSHAHFAEYKGKRLGSFGDIACASLQGPKLISGGEAGVLVTDNDDFYEQAVLLGHNLKRSQAIVDATEKHPFSGLGRTGYGLKFRCHPLAALLIEDQIRNYAHTWINERHNSLSKLSAALSDLPGIRPPVIRNYVSSMGAWYGYKPWVDTNELGITKATLVKALQAEGADVKSPRSEALNELALYAPAQFPILNYPKHDNSHSSFPQSKRYQSGLLSLPTPTGKRDEQVLDCLISSFHKVWENLDELRHAEKNKHPSLL